MKVLAFAAMGWITLSAAFNAFLANRPDLDQLSRADAEHSTPVDPSICWNCNDWHCGTAQISDGADIIIRNMNTRLECRSLLVKYILHGTELDTLCHNIQSA